MALLILNDDEINTPGRSPETERFYEFDPNDRAAINRIHTILSLRKKGSAEKSEKILADVCTRSLEQNELATTTVHVKSWFRILSGYIPKFNFRNRIHFKTKHFNLISGRINKVHYPSI